MHRPAATCNMALQSRTICARFILLTVMTLCRNPETHTNHQPCMQVVRETENAEYHATRWHEMRAKQRKRKEKKEERMERRARRKPCWNANRCVVYSCIRQPHSCLGGLCFVVPCMCVHCYAMVHHFFPKPPQSCTHSLGLHLHQSEARSSQTRVSH